MKEKTLSQHLSTASKTRWAKTTPEQRSAYAKMLVAAREEKRAAKKAAAERGITVPESEPVSDIKDIKDAA